jgi:glucose-6-phosphate 1-dehydrogenase
MTEPVPPSRSAAAADPCTVVIFGATGDLTKRLVVPALYNLARTNVLPTNFALLGVALEPGSAQTWQAHLHTTLESFVGNHNASFDIDHIDETVWTRLAASMSYAEGDLTDPAFYTTLRGKLEATAQASGTAGNVIFYLALADRLFGTVVEQLAAAGLTEEPAAAHGTPQPWRRVVIEKPFGHDMESARALNECLARSLRETQIFRIDHFLGKEAVQSIMAFRFANGLFEPIWNRDRIDHVQITVAETAGVEDRGKFYEVTGALRDMVPNHVFSLLSMIAMEPPTSFDAAGIRARKTEIFAAMPTVRPGSVVRGQYGAGAVLGQAARAYRQEHDVAADSTVETYVAMRLDIDNWRWAGVPFYFRTGKHLAQRMTEIAISFKQAPFMAFKNTPVAALKPNWLVLRISPNEGISLQFEVKKRGGVLELAAVKMDFRYDDWFDKEPNVGYETLLHDVMSGDQTLFMGGDAAEQGWRVMQPVLDAWAKDATDLAAYASGSDGPDAAKDLLWGDGKRVWRDLDLQA